MTVNQNIVVRVHVFPQLNLKVMEKKLKTLQASSINRIIAGANEIGIKKEDIVDIVTVPNGYILIYFG